MGLHVGRLGPEQRLGAVDREGLHLVDELAAAVIPLARISLGVLVGEHRALRLEHRLAHHVLGGDQLEVVLLPLGLPANGGVHRGIGPGQGGTRIAHATAASPVVPRSITSSPRSWKWATSTALSSAPPWSAPAMMLGMRLTCGSRCRSRRPGRYGSSPLPRRRFPCRTLPRAP